MSHAFVGVLTGARIHSIELDRACFPIRRMYSDAQKRVRT